jgi:hypothetical protein
VGSGGWGGVGRGGEGRWVRGLGVERCGKGDATALVEHRWISCLCTCCWLPRESRARQTTLSPLPFAGISFSATARRNAPCTPRRPGPASCLAATHAPDTHPQHPASIRYARRAQRRGEVFSRLGWAWQGRAADAPAAELGSLRNQRTHGRASSNSAPPSISGCSTCGSSAVGQLPTTAGRIRICGDARPSRC